jgi:hypothetical protein
MKRSIHNAANPILAPRASTILYNLLLSQKDRRAFILPANICPIVPITFFKAGIPFEFVDILERGLHMDLEQAEERIRTGKFRGLLYAHTYGDPSMPRRFLEEIKKNHPDLLLIDDRCLCIPDLEPDLSNPADVILYSTGYGKVVDQGFGGFAFLSGDLTYQTRSLPFNPQELETLENTFKRSIEAREPFVFSNSNWLQTDSDLPAWTDFKERVRSAREKSIAHRQSINAVYNSLIPPDLCLSEPYQLWRFNLRLPDKKKTLAALFAEQLFASSHYASLAGIMGKGYCPRAHRLWGEIVNLFNDTHYTLEMAERTTQIVLRSL